MEILPGKEALLHISEFAWERVESTEGYFKEGQQLEVKLIGVDDKTGKLKLSRKVLLPKPEGYVERPPRQNSDRRPPRRDDDRRGQRRDDRRDDRRPPRRDRDR